MAISDADGAQHREVPVEAVRKGTRRGKRFWIPVLIGAVVGLVVGTGWLKSGDTEYVATGTVFVTFDFPPEVLDPFSGSQFVTERIDSYAQLAKSPAVLGAMADDVRARSATEIANGTTVTTVPGTVMLRVVARDSDPQTATAIADSMMTHLSSAVAGVEAGGPDGVSPIDLVPVQPAIVGPASTLLTDAVRSAAGLAVGTLLGALVGWVLSRRQSGRRRSVAAAHARRQPETAVDEPQHGILNADRQEPAQ